LGIPTYPIWAFIGWLVASPSPDWLPPFDLPSSVLELANLYAAFARDFHDGTHTAPTFEDGLWMHRLLERIALSPKTGQRSILH
jgi:predicted dehydrogenase